MADFEHNVDVGLSGHFTLTAVKKDGTRRELANFPNLILNQGLDRLCVPSSYNVIFYAQVGSGSTPVAAGQTQLAAWLAGITAPLQADLTQLNEPPYYSESRKTWRFPEGRAAGVIAEVGVGWAETGQTLFSRALVLDAAGNPTTVTVLPDEALDVTYRLRVYPSLVDSLSTLNINGVAHTLTMRPSRAGQRDQFNQPYVGDPNAAVFYSTATGVYTGGIGPLTSAPSGSESSGNSTRITVPYTPGTFRAEGRLRFPLTSGNLAGGLRSMEVRSLAGGLGRYQIEFDPPIPKTDKQIFTVDLRFQLARRDAT